MRSLALAFICIYVIDADDITCSVRYNTGVA